LVVLGLVHALGGSVGGPRRPAGRVNLSVLLRHPLVVRPTDLTQLSGRNNGIFPTVRVIMRIDGRDPLVSHGSAMPVYGDFFEGIDVATKAETGQPIMTSQPIVDLLVYLKGIQK